ncbi:alpha-L-fucosidase [Vibrio mimicus]|uniref:alpha-L-fucosidase n=1 Tax=Vibrio mimicus TaxID=674 RepID=UPI0039DF572B
MNDQQSTPATDKVSDSSSKGWFVKDRFGMFIHWGFVLCRRVAPVAQEQERTHYRTISEIFRSL